jgi:hypothetical protein
MALVAVSCLLGCHDESPTQPSTNLNGAYLLKATESCGQGYGEIDVQIVQTGNRIGFRLGVDTGGVEGTIRASTIDLTWTKSVDAGILCESQLTGTATIDGRWIRGSVSGMYAVRSCFSCASDTIAFTLVRQ